MNFGFKFKKGINIIEFPYQINLISNNLMHKNKVVFKKSPTVTQQASTLSSSRLPYGKKEPYSSTQGSSKDNNQKKQEPTIHPPTVQSPKPKPSFLKPKNQKNQDHSKIKHQVVNDQNICHKNTPNQKVFGNKKVDNRIAVSEKYQEYFDLKGIPLIRGKQYKKNQQLSQSGDSMSSLNSIKSEGAKNLLVRKYPTIQKINNPPSLKHTAYSIKNPSNSSFSSKPSQKPKQIGKQVKIHKQVKLHTKIKSTFNSDEQEKKKLTETKSVSKVESLQPKKMSEGRITPLKSYDSHHNTKSQKNKFLVKNKNELEKEKKTQNKPVINQTKKKIETGYKRTTLSNNYGLLDKKNKQLNIQDKKEKKFTGTKMNQPLPFIKKNTDKSPIKRQRLITNNDGKDLPCKTITLFLAGTSDPLTLILLKKLAIHEKSKVYLCLHPPSSSIYCLKSSKVMDRIQLNHLITQSKIGSQINHSNLVRTYCALYDSKHLYIMMEFMEQRTLYHQLHEKVLQSKVQKAQKSEKQSDIIWVRETLYQILLGLNCLHQNGIVHRDIKPENIFISHGTYKIGDFGSASINNTQEYVGTLDYTSPEILQKRPYNKSVDMWGIGCIAYQLDQKHPPFFHIDRNQTIRRIINVQYQSSPISDPDLRDLIEKLLVIPGNLRLTVQEVLKHPFFKEAPNFNFESNQKL